MHQLDRHALLFGPYESPRFKYGEVVFCEWRGEVTIVSITDARIPWPVGKKRGQAGAHKALVIYAGLAEAVRRESEVAVAHWWGVTAQTVGKWRRALDVPTMTEGTRRLWSVKARSEPMIAARKKAQAKADDPERRRKIANSKRGQKRPGHVIEALRAANLGRRLSDEHRAKLSAAQRKRGARPPNAGRTWTAEEDEIVRRLPPAQAAAETGRPLSSISKRRKQLGLPDGRTRSESR